MPYRSELEAALARIDTMTAPPPCPACAAREKRRARIRSAFASGFVAFGTLLVLAFAGVAGLVAASVFLVGFGMAATGGDGSGVCFVLGLCTTAASAVLYGAFAWLNTRGRACS